MTVLRDLPTMTLDRVTTPERAEDVGAQKAAATGRWGGGRSMRQPYDFRLVSAFGGFQIPRERARLLTGGTWGTAYPSALSTQAGQRGVIVDHATSTSCPKAASAIRATASHLPAMTRQGQGHGVSFRRSTASRPVAAPAVVLLCLAIRQ